MKNFRHAALVSAALLAGTASAAYAATDPTVVMVNKGTLNGAYGTSNDVISFLGVPYAKADRWQPPVAVDPFGTRDAKAFGHVCPQDNATPDQSEDCLFLNVWKPANATKASKLPVMVFIHGGSFQNGSSSLQFGPTNVRLYDGENLARRGVIVVTINYRLGRLGWFAHPLLTQAAASGARLANYGMMDQIAALYWVNGNIGYFGGDKSKVTLFGESAGAGAVQLLLSSPQTKGLGLFQKAISESGSGIADLPYIRAPGAAVACTDDKDSCTWETRGKAWADSYFASKNKTDYTLQDMQNIPYTDLVSGNEGYPCIDGQVIAESAGDAVAKMHEMQIPLIVGSNTWESMPLGFKSADVSDFIGSSNYNMLLQKYRTAEASDTPPIDSGPAPQIDLNEDVFMVQASRWIGETHAGYGPATYAYTFGEVATTDRSTSAGTYGTPHAGELQFVFGNQASTDWDDQDKAIAQYMGDYWTNFAKNGNPSMGATVPSWTAIGKQRPTAYQHIGWRTSVAGTSTPLAQTVPSTALEEQARDIMSAAAKAKWAQSAATQN